MILDNNAKIWIYGYGLRGRELASRLKKNGIEIYGYIDRNPERYDDIPEKISIVKLEQTVPTCDAIVICSIANVFEHENIAMQLAEHGFSYIIYKTFRKNTSAKKISNLYDDLVGVFENVITSDYGVPSYVDIATEESISNEADNNIIQVNIPVELLFGLREQSLEESFLEKRKDLIEKISEKSLLYYTGPQKMMQYFIGEMDESAWEKWKEIWFACRNAQTFHSPQEGSYNIEEQYNNIEERYRIFLKMQHLYATNPNFFIENPISIVGNEKGYFNIEDGNNRAAFLLAKNNFYIPSKLPRKDYNDWLGTKEDVAKVKNCIDELQGNLYAPILHPDFNDVFCDTEYYAHKKVTVVCEWLWKHQIDVKKMSVCEYYCKNDLCASHMARMGALVSVVDSDKQVQLHKALDNLYRLKDVCYIDRQMENEQYDIIFLNNAEYIMEIKEKNIRAKWGIIEFVDKSDEEIGDILLELADGEVEFLLRQLVGSRIYKVVVIKGKN